VRLRASAQERYEPVRYAYGCPRWSRAQRRFLGWRDVLAERQPAPNRPAYTTVERYDSGEACGARLADSARRNGAGQYVGERSIVAYLPVGNAAPHVCLPQQVRHLRYASNAAPGRAFNTVREFTYDEFGNVVIDREAGANRSGDERTTTRSYRAATGAYIVGLAAGEQRHDGIDASAPILYSRLLCYDGDATIACSQSPARGQLTSTVDLYEQGTRVTRYAYDAWGNVASVIGADQNGIAITYDPVQHRFPTSVTGPRPVRPAAWSCRRNGIACAG
jgi:YD repeat-containing protein